MTDEKYVEISSKVLEAEAIVKNAIGQFESELADIFSEVSKEDMAKWLQIAEVMARSVSCFSIRPLMDGEQAILKKSERCQ